MESTQNSLDQYYTCLKQDKMVKMKSKQVEDLNIVDICLTLKGQEEDKLYIKHQEYLQKVRRGNTIIIKGNHYYLVRRGMKKFFDYKAKYFKKENHHQDLYDANFSEVRKMIEDNKRIKVIKTEKLDGCNAQISYIDELDTFIIASKNCSLLANKRSDFEQYSEMQYDYARQIGEQFFEMVDLMEDQQVIKLKKAMTNKTFVGEYIGNNEHLIKYDKVEIIFYAIVDNQSLFTCQPFAESVQTFIELGMKYVDYQYVEDEKGEQLVIDNLKDFDYLLLQLFFNTSNNQQKSEGYVIYFEIDSQNINEQNIISMVKLKNFHYIFLRIIREYSASYAKSNDLKYLLIIKQRIDEMKTEFEFDSNYYQQIADKIYQFIQQNQQNPALHYFISYNFIQIVEYIEQNKQKELQEQLKQLQKNQKIKIILFNGLFGDQFEDLTNRNIKDLQEEERFIHTQKISLKKGNDNQNQYVYQNEIINDIYQQLYKIMEKRYKTQQQYIFINSNLLYDNKNILINKIQSFIQFQNYLSVEIKDLYFFDNQKIKDIKSFNGFPIDYIIIQSQQILNKYSLEQNQQEQIERFIYFINNFDKNNNQKDQINYYSINLIQNNINNASKYINNLITFLYKLQQKGDKMNKKQFEFIQDQIYKSQIDIKDSEQISKQIINIINK